MGALNSSGGARVGDGGTNGDGGASESDGGTNGDGAAESDGGAEGDGGDPNPTPGSAGEAGSSASSGAVACRRDGDGKTTLVFRNGCADTVTFRGSDITGGVIKPGAHVCVDVGSDTESLSSKRYWGFSGTDPGAEHHTLAEFTFNTDFYDFDWYNISHVDAHNLPLQIVAVNRDCEVLTCAESWLEDCPEEGRLLDESGRVTACVSPDRDNPESPVALFFERCDEGYAWSGDDQHGDDPSPMRACAGEDWDIVFCPEPEE